MRTIESAVRQRVNCIRDSKEHSLSPVEECILVLRAELCEILGVVAAQSPQEGLERGGSLEENIHVVCADVEPPASAKVCRFPVAFPLSSC